MLPLSVREHDPAEHALDLIAVRLTRLRARWARLNLLMEPPDLDLLMTMVMRFTITQWLEDHLQSPGRYKVWWVEAQLDECLRPYHVEQHPFHRWFPATSFSNSKKREHARHANSRRQRAMRRGQRGGNRANTTVPRAAIPSPAQCIIRPQLNTSTGGSDSFQPDVTVASENSSSVAQVTIPSPVCITRLNLNTSTGGSDSCQRDVTVANTRQELGGVGNCGYRKDSGIC